MDSYVVSKRHKIFDIGCIVLTDERCILLFVDDFEYTVRGTILPCNITGDDIGLCDQFSLFVIPQVLLRIINFNVSATDIIQSAFLCGLLIDRFTFHRRAAGQVLL